MSGIAAVILAGGRGERLGGANKALIEIGGKRLIERALEAVAECTPVILSIGDADFGWPALVPVPDLPTDYGGPLAGVAAAVDHLQAAPPALLLTLAVDTPFFPHDFVTRALPLLATAPAAISAYGGQIYPTNGLWRFDRLATLPGEVRNGTAPRSLKRLAERLSATRLDYAGVSATDPFSNANTLQDLEILQRRAR